MQFHKSMFRNVLFTFNAERCENSNSDNQKGIYMNLYTDYSPFQLLISIFRLTANKLKEIWNIYIVIQNRKWQTVRKNL